MSDRQLQQILPKGRMGFLSTLVFGGHWTNFVILISAGISLVNFDQI